MREISDSNGEDFDGKCERQNGFNCNWIWNCGNVATETKSIDCLLELDYMPSKSTKLCSDLDSINWDALCLILSSSPSLS